MSLSIMTHDHVIQQNDTQHTDTDKYIPCIPFDKMTKSYYLHSAFRHLGLNEALHNDTQDNGAQGNETQHNNRQYIMTITITAHSA